MISGACADDVVKLGEVEIVSELEVSVVWKAEVVEMLVVRGEIPRALVGATETKRASQTGYGVFMAAILE